MKKYKFKIEVAPHYAKFLSPRHHIGPWEFRKLRKKIVELRGCQCEACGKEDGIIELHESFSIKKNTYIFDGFFLLCDKCHDLVHYFQFSHFPFGLDPEMIAEVWDRHEIIRKYSIYKNKKSFIKSAQIAYNSALDFIMADMVSADYSNAKEYGMSPDELQNGFNTNYNHFSGRIRFIINCVNPDGCARTRSSTDLDVHKQYAEKQYLQHKDFFINNRHILFDGNHPQREETIIKYANTMKLQLL